MKINFPMIQRDMTEQITVPYAPPMIKKECGLILQLMERTPIPDYNKISGFDKWLTVAYWKQFDAMPEDRALWDDWLIYKATSPDIIIRARQYLVEKNYLIPKASMEKWAQTAAKGWKR